MVVKYKKKSYILLLNTAKSQLVAEQGEKS